MRTIYWFKNNLRLRDNPSLEKAIKVSDEVLPVYILDSRLFQKHPLGFNNLGDFRKKFLFEAISELQNSLANLGSDLKILIGDPIEIIPELVKSHKADQIFTSKEPGYYEQSWDKILGSRYPLESIDDNSLFELGSLSIFNRDSTPGFSAFRKNLERNPIRNSSAKIEKLPPYSGSIASAPIQIPEVDTDKRSAFPYSGGEKNGWEHLKKYIWTDKLVTDYKTTRNELIGSSYSSKFSPWLAIGNLSPVIIYQEIINFEKEVIKNESTYWLYFELLWREYFRHLGFRFGKHLFDGTTEETKSLNKKEALNRLHTWAEGNTNNQFINANMNELNLTGFMSNRGRQNVASYLMHDLGLDWRWGAAYFESRLIDYDCCSNWGNWRYIAGEINSAEPKVFDVIHQAQRYDQEGNYVKLWS